MLPAPRACPSAAPSDAQGGKGRCTGTSLLELEGSKVCVDYQEIKIQDQVRKLLFFSPMSRLPLSFPFSPSYPLSSCSPSLVVSHPLPPSPHLKCL